MKKQLMSAALAAAISVAVGVPTAQAQIPVTDGVNLTNNIMSHVEDIAKMVQQIATLKAQLEQAENLVKNGKQTLESMTGTRGMSQLLSDQNYKRIPTNWEDTLNAMSGGGSGAIQAQAQKILKTMNGIDPAVFTKVDGAYGKLYGDQADSAATYQALQGKEYDDTAARFKDLKKLITKIGTAQDQKAILNLNARIGAQQVMLQNELLKMQAMAQVRQAQKDMQKARARQAFINDAHAGAAPLPPITLDN